MLKENPRIIEIHSCYRCPLADYQSESTFRWAYYKCRLTSLSVSDAVNDRLLHSSCPLELRYPVEEYVI